jgi:hypothetical protein
MQLSLSDSQQELHEPPPSTNGGSHYKHSHNNAAVSNAASSTGYYCVCVCVCVWIWSDMLFNGFFCEPYVKCGSATVLENVQRAVIHAVLATSQVTMTMHIILFAFSNTALKKLLQSQIKCV